MTAVRRLQAVNVTDWNTQPESGETGLGSDARTIRLMIFVVTPAGELKEFFDALHDLEDLDEAIARSTAHGVEFVQGV